MTWIFAAVALGSVGLVVLAIAGVRVLRAARGLSREIARARERVEPVTERLRAHIGANGSRGDESGLPAAYDRG